MALSGHPSDDIETRLSATEARRLPSPLPLASGCVVPARGDAGVARLAGHLHPLPDEPDPLPLRLAEPLPGGGGSGGGGGDVGVGGEAAGDLAHALAVGGVGGGLAVEGLVGVGSAVLELAPHLEEGRGRGRGGCLGARRRRGGRGEEEGGGVEGGDGVEACEREELGLPVASLDLALHGGEHLLGLARDPPAEEARLPPPPPRGRRLGLLVGLVPRGDPSPRRGARRRGRRRGEASPEVVADEVLEVPAEIGGGAHAVVVLVHGIGIRIRIRIRINAGGLDWDWGLGQDCDCECEEEAFGEEEKRRERKGINCWIERLDGARGMGDASHGEKEPKQQLQ